MNATEVNSFDQCLNYSLGTIDHVNSKGKTTKVNITVDIFLKMTSSNYFTRLFSRKKYGVSENDLIQFKNKTVVKKSLEKLRQDINVKNKITNAKLQLSKSAVRIGKSSGKILGALQDDKFVTKEKDFDKLKFKYSSEVEDYEQEKIATEIKIKQILNKKISATRMLNRNEKENKNQFGNKYESNKAIKDCNDAYRIQNKHLSNVESRVELAQNNLNVCKAASDAVKMYRTIKILDERIK